MLLPLLSHKIMSYLIGFKGNGGSVFKEIKAIYLTLMKEQPKKQKELRR